MANLHKCFRLLCAPVTLGAGLFSYYTWTNKNLSDNQSDSNSEFRFWPFHMIVAKASYTHSFKPKRPWTRDWDKHHPGTVGKQAVDGSSESIEKDPVINSGDEQLSKSSRHLLFIRHGQYIFSQNDDDCKLTELGHYQADMTGQRLKQLGLKYDRVYYSTMTRAIETAEEILKHLPGVPAKSSSLLEEGAPYPPEPPLPSYNPSQERYFEDGARIEAAFRHLFHRAPASQTKDTVEVVVCHANVIRYFLCRALQFPPEAWLRFSLDHGSITWITIRPSGRVAVRYVGSSGHMPAAKCTVQ